MKVTLTKAESEKHFYNALCNGINYIFNSYGLELTCDDADYAKAKKSIQKKMELDEMPTDTICREDVYMENLRLGGKLKLIDTSKFAPIPEQSEPDKIISLKDVHKRVAKTPIDHLTDMIEERDDAVTADVMLQTVFYQEVIFG